MTRPRLAIITPSFAIGGVERVMISLANAMAEDGVAVDLVPILERGPLRQSVSDAVRIHDLRASRAIAAVPGLVRYLRESRPDAVLSGLDYINVVTLWANRLAGSPSRVCVSVHNFMSLAIANAEELRTRLLMRPAMRASYGMASAIIALNDAMAADLAGILGQPQDRITVLPNLVVTEEHVRLGQAPAPHPWANAPERPLVLGIGRLARQKSFALLIRAFAPLADETGARLLILGEGEERGRLEAEIAAGGLGEVVALNGATENPHAYLARAALMVLSSEHEGLPTVIIEALAQGCPVVSTDCPSGPAEILSGGTLGPLVPVGDAAALTEAMRRTLADPIPRERLLERARDYSAERVLPLYRAVLGI